MGAFFSIIVPVYNSSSTIKRCIDSLLDQEFDDFEVICIDDGSTDDSYELLKLFAACDSRIRCYTQQNRGPAAVRNRGIDEAEGKWILFVDSDDYLCDVRSLGILNQAITNHHDCELVCFSGAVATSEGIFPDVGQEKVFESGRLCLEQNCLVPKGVVFGSVFVQCYKKSVIDAIGLRFDEKIWYAEDRLFVCSYYLRAGMTVVLSDVLYCYVVNDNSLMHDENRKTRMCRDQRKAVKLIESQMKETGKDLPHLRKYLHGLYVKSIDGLKRKEIDWKFIFRNASTVKLKVKDALLFLGVNIY